MNFDFESIKQEMKDRLSLLSNWAETLYYGVYERLIDVIAYITEKLAYLAEYYYTEAGWTTATVVEYLMHKVDWLNYKPYRKQGAIGDLTLSADSTFDSLYKYTGESVIIPKWTMFTNLNGNSFVYCTTETIYYQGTVGDITIPVKEGVYTEYVYVAEGLSSEIISLSIPNIDNEEVEVFIVDGNNNILFTVFICGEGDVEDDIYLIDDLDNYYCQIKNSYDFQSVSFTFGDGISTKKLNVDVRILIKYGATNGDEGNITNTGVITVIQDTLYDAEGNEAILYINNDEEISDGSDTESLQSIKINGSNLFQAGYRAGSVNDWESIIESLSYINKVKVWSAEDEGDTTPSNLSKVYVSAVSSDGTELTSAQETLITTEMKERKSPTEIISFRDLEKVYLLFDIEATVINLAFSSVDTIVYTELDDTYGVLNVDFKEDVFYSNYIRVIDNLDEIIHHQTIASYLEKNFEAITVDYALTPCTLSGDADDKILLTSGTSGLWIQRKVEDAWISGAIQIAQEISGSLIGTNGFTISFSDINNAENEISFTVQDLTSGTAYGVKDPGEDDPDGYLLSLSYKTNDGNIEQLNDIRLGARTNITDIDTDFIFTDFEYA